MPFCTLHGHYESYDGSCPSCQENAAYPDEIPVLLEAIRGGRSTDDDDD